MPGFRSNTVQVHVFRRDDLGNYEFLILRRADDEEIYPGVWQFVTGTLNDGETAVQCAVRELKEETGLVPETVWNVPYVGRFFNPYTDEVNFSPVFAVETGRGNVELSHEHDDYLWLSYPECFGRILIPSHNEAQEIIKKFIIDNDNNSMFVIPEKLYVKK